MIRLSYAFNLFRIFCWRYQNSNCSMRLPATIVFSIAQFFVCIVSFAQNENVDSLKGALAAQRDTGRIESTVSLWVCCTERPDKDSLFYNSNLCLEESVNMNYAPGIAGAITHNAWTANRACDFPLTEAMAHETLWWDNRISNKKINSSQAKVN